MHDFPAGAAPSQSSPGSIWPLPQAAPPLPVPPLPPLPPAPVVALLVVAVDVDVLVALDVVSAELPPMPPAPLESVV
jgi:hypothetical protein